MAHPPYRTPPPGTVPTGTAVPLPPAYAQLNTSADGTLGIKKYIDDSYQKTGQLPNGFHVENGHAVEDEPGFLFRHPWLFPVIGITAGLALPAIVGTAPVLGPSTAANTAATASVVNGGAVPSSLAAAGGGGSTVGAAGNILKYVLPTAGDIVGGLIQANAAGNATEAQQRYLEEALAYQKEQDAYNRTRQEGLDRQEVTRYGDYQGRIAPFIANGTTSNDRMAALLGLPARTGSTSRGGSGGGGELGDPITYADRLSAADKLKVDAELKAANSNDNPAYWYGVNAQHGGFDATGADWNHQRISTGDGVGKGYTAPAGAAAPTLTTQPLARSADVPMRAPDGSVKTVPSDQVEFYRQRGATLLQGAA